MVYVRNIRVVFAFCAADGSNNETMGSQTKHTGKNFYDGLLVNIFGDIKTMLGPVYDFRLLLIMPGLFP
jgi:hypothetical protein